MKDYTKEQIEKQEYSPSEPRGEVVDGILEALYSDKTKRMCDFVCEDLTYEELITVLLNHRDYDMRKKCFRGIDIDDLKLQNSNIILRPSYVIRKEETPEDIMNLIQAGDIWKIASIDCLVNPATMPQLNNDDCVQLISWLKEVLSKADFIWNLNLGSVDPNEIIRRSKEVGDDEIVRESEEILGDENNNE